MGTAWRDSKGAVVAVVALALFTDMILYGVLVPTLPYLIERRFPGTPIDDMGVIVSSYAAGLLVVPPIVGSWSDHHRNRKWPMVMGILGVIVSTLLFAYTTQFALFLLARCLQGVSAGVTWTIGMSMLADIYPSDQLGSMSSRVMGASTAALMVGPPLGGFLFTSISLEAPYLFCAVISLFDLLLRFWVRPEKVTKNDEENREHQPLLQDDIEQQDQPTDCTESSSNDIESSNPSSITMATLLTDFQCIITLIGIGLEAGVYCGLELVLALHLSKQFHYTPMEIGWLYFAIVVPDALTAFLVGPISDKLGRKNVIAVGLVLYGLTLMALPFAYDTLTWIVVLVAYGVAAAIAITPSSPEVAEIVDAKGGGGYGRAYALYNVAYSLGMLVGPTAAGYLYSQYGFHTCMFILAVLLWSFTPIVVMAWIIKRRASTAE